MTILAPITYGSLKEALHEANETDVPIAIRYPNASESTRVIKEFYSDVSYSDFGVRANFDASSKPDVVVFTYGSIVNNVIKASDSVRKQGINVGIVLIERLKPYDRLAEEVSPYIGESKVLFVEEGIKAGGAAMLLGEALYKYGALKPCNYFVSAIEDNFAAPDLRVELYDSVGLSPDAISKKISAIAKNNSNDLS
jgi:deoxyxylulose-5-phosphate synthase